MSSLKFEKKIFHRSYKRPMEDQLAKQVLYDLWYEYAERLFNKVVTTCQLSEEKIEVLRLIYLRPNDFKVNIT